MTNERNNQSASRPGRGAPPPSVPEQSTSSQTKPEGSEYASAYRPSDPPASLPPNTSAYEHHVQADTTNPDHPPPAYSVVPGEINEDSNEVDTNAVVTEDGRVNIRINQKSRRLSQLFTPQINNQISQIENDPSPPPPYIPESLGGVPGQDPPPPLNLVIMVVGSRGDVQPFVALGKVLKETYGHRVRLATHPVFKDFVAENGLEFFSIGGDPAELMAFMVKNPGLMPGFDVMRSGDIGNRRKGIAEILSGTWRACIETGDGLGIDPLKQTVEEWTGAEEGLPEPLKRPFVADAIIANPPSFGHIHCAEKLGIPLHMMFTMPWSPTQQFPHPLANIQSSNADASITNFMSYTLVDMLTWQGLGDIINRFRNDSLGLEEVSMIWAPNMLSRLKIPYTYCWSPALIPKPKDWGKHISIAGFYFLDLSSAYTPEPALAEYLAAGESPVYIGFGSIVVDDPNAMTTMIFEAVKKTGRRALVSKGWGGLGADDLGIPDGVFMLGNVPHDWLFKHVSAVVHHGGAGTTAAGISAGRPTVVVPFFGDQPFWGAMTAKAGAGPPPIPYKELTADKLADAITQALKPESLERAKELAEKIRQEQGSQNGAQNFHQMLKYDDLRCAVAPYKPAVWRIKRTQVRLSAMAATVLTQAGELSFSDLKLYRPREYETDEGPWDPITGGATAIVGTATQMMMGVADFPIETLKLLSIHPDVNKGKGKAKASSNASTPAESTRPGRSSDARPTTSTQLSGSSSATTVPGINTPGTSVAESPSSTPGTPNARTAFTTHAMSMSSQVSRSPSRERTNSQTSSIHGRPPATSVSSSESHLNRSGTGQSFANRLQGMNAEAAVGTGKGLGRMVGAGFKSPMDFTLNVAKGFHNVPKLYGGEVRQVDKVTDFSSGMRTAAKELGFGFYQGITGLVTDPLKGAKKEGGVGFIKGVGRGIAGVPLHIMSGVFAVPGYTMKGLYQEGMKSKGANVQNYIIAARISQGYDEANTVARKEKDEIVKRFKCISLNVKKKKNIGEGQVEALSTMMKERRDKRSNARAPGNSATSSQARTSSSTPVHHANKYSLPPMPAQAPNNEDEEADRLALEAAIRASVNETSHGDPHEDELIARAIRASAAELERPVDHHEDEEEALQRALKASIEEAQKSGATEEEQRMLEETLRASMLDNSNAAKRRGSDSEWDSSDTEDDEDYQRIIAESKELAHMQAHQTPDNSHIAPTSTAQESGTTSTHPSDLPPSYSSVPSQAPGEGDEDEDFRKALKESERAEKQRKQDMDKQLTEEEAMFEQVKKQSLAEEEHRRRAAQGRGTEGESSGSR